MEVTQAEAQAAAQVQNVILAEKAIKDDIFTSVHIEEFELQVRDTKRGVEEITREIPNVSEDAVKNLDDEGVAIPGQVGRRFAGTGCRVEIARDAFCRLRRKQQAPVIGLADRDDQIAYRSNGIASMEHHLPDTMQVISEYGDLTTIGELRRGVAP